MGFSFVAFGFYVIYGQTTFVISHSTEKAAVVSQAFTAISAAWHFIALIPVASLVQRVRSEEWW
jgi:MFS-type transporter involved in bile tolerance (Atg22 family)